MKYFDHIDEHGFLGVQWRGPLSREAAEVVFNRLLKFETQHPQGFHRFIDHSRTTHVTITSSEVVALAKRRRLESLGPPVNSAIWTLDPVVFGLSRMFVAMTGNTPIRGVRRSRIRDG